MKKTRVKYMMALLLLIPLSLFLQHVFAEEDEKTVYITFDDGPTLNTPKIVDTLRDYDARATFFVLEERIVMYPDYIRKIALGGNALGLHGVSHSEAIYSTPTSPLEEMEKTNKALKSLMGRGSSLVRVPFGSCYRLTEEQQRLLCENGYKIWDWNVDPRDSVGKITVQKVMSNLKKDLQRCESDPVILLHDRKSTADMLPILLQYLKEEGYRMLPLSEKQTPLNFVTRGVK